MKAKEAKALTSKNRRKITQDAIDTAFRLIKEAASNGRSSTLLSIKDEILMANVDVVIKTLENNGYEIKFFRSEYTHYELIDIRW